MTGPGDDTSTPGSDADAGERERLRRFTAAYRGDLAPADALFWAEHLLEATPAGSASPFAAHESRRRDLYRPGADPGAADDVRAEGERLARERRMIADALAVAETDAGTTGAPDLGMLDATDAGTAASPGTGWSDAPDAGAPDREERWTDPASARSTDRLRRRDAARPRAARVALATGAAVIAAAAVLAVQAVRDQLPVAPPAATASGSSLIPPNQTALDPLIVPPVGDVAERASQRADAARLWSVPAGSALGAYFGEHPAQRPSVLTDIRDSYVADGHGGRTFPVRLGPGGELSIFLMCDHPVGYSLTVELRDDTGSDASILGVYGRGDDCTRLAYSALGLGEGWSVDSITVYTTAHTRYLLDAELAP